MASLTDTELVRARWRRHLRAEALDTTLSDDFAQRGLATRVQHLVFRALLLPFDPDLERPGIEEIASQLDSHRNMSVGNGSVHFGGSLVPTTHASALVTQSRNGTSWERFVAVHRNGAVELGLGDGLRELDGEDAPRFVELVTVASFTWAMLELARHLDAESVAQPRLLAVALPNTVGKLLGNLAVGYREPGTYHNRMQGCPDDHLLWHIELERPPADADESNALALRVASRMTNAWGTSQTLHLDREGDLTGQLNVRRAAQ